MKNVHILSTDKASRLIQAEDDELMLLNELYENTYNINKHIYIISDEYIGLSYYLDGSLVRKGVVDDKDYWEVRKDYKKIILTTDQELIKDGVQSIDEEFLKWVVKNPSCDFIRTLKVPYFDESSHSYLLVIPKEESKQELSLKINDEFLDTTSKEILYTLMEEFDNLVTENSSEETPKQEITIEEIEQQITLTEARGERVIKYLDKYKGQSIYNEIALAIEFGYQLKLEEDE